MALFTLANAQLAFGHVPLLDHATFSLESQERVGLIGRNGSGKSSLLKILAGRERMDDGTFHQQQGLQVAYVPQESDFSAHETVFDAVQHGLSDVLRWIEQYTHGQGDLDTLQRRIEHVDGWNWKPRVDGV